VLDPTCEGAAARAADRRDAKVIESLWENIQNLAAWAERYGPEAEHMPSRVNVRVYTAVPRMALMQWDNTLLVSFFERDKPISLSRTTILSVDQPIAAFFFQCFHDLWIDRHTVSIKEFWARHGAARMAALKQATNAPPDQQAQKDKPA
jgi:hypothetical protein